MGGDYRVKQTQFQRKNDAVR